MRKIAHLLGAAFAGVVLVYLSLPLPEIPDLPDSLKSDEPGDTVQISGVSAYYTDVSRQEVLRFYQEHFSQSSFLSLPLPIITLNHPPEYGKEAIRDTTESTFLYELVHPFRDSLFINGWDPAESKALREAVADPTKIIQKKGRYYERKIILRVMPSLVWLRILIFFFSFGLLTIIFKGALNTVVRFSKKWRKK